MSTPANWHPDPSGRHELRYWDGTVWTAHVSDGGRQSTDPLGGPPPPRADDGFDRIDAALTVGDEADPNRIQRQLHDQGMHGAGIQGAVGGGGGTIFDEPILVVNQKAKLIELNNQYSVFDQHGRQLAAVNQVGQSAAKKAMRLLTSLDQFMTHRLEISEPSGRVLLRLTRPAKIIKSTVVVESPDGHEIGRIVQQNAIGKINFGLESGGHQLGSIKGENWRAWNFRIEDATGSEVARITKTFEGLAKTLFTTADNYVVQFHHRLPQPFNALVVASALSIDTALKQDARGLG
ncbi:MAG: phospholipid scramblase-related protein [Acidimicrobiales bacterium]